MSIINRKADKNKQHTKSLDTENRTVHDYIIKTNIEWKFHVTEPSIRKAIAILFYILGLVSFYLFQQEEFITKLVEIRDYLYKLTPFARKMMENKNFWYAFRIGCVITAIYSIFLCIMCKIELKSILKAILISCLFAFCYLYINYGVCLLIIKIPIYFKVLSVIASIVSNLVLGIGILCGIFTIMDC